MSKLVVISCGSKKIWDKNPNAGPTPARDVYISGYVTILKSYPQRFGIEWVILSAKFGFIDPNFIIREPYNVTFKDADAIKDEQLRQQVEERRLDEYEEIIVLGGKEYANKVRMAFAGTNCLVRTPLEGLSIGKIMKKVKDAVTSGNEL